MRANQSATDKARNRISYRSAKKAGCGSRFLNITKIQPRVTDMNPIVEAVAFLLGFLAWIMVGVALPNRYWRVSTVDGNVITTSTIYENLWMSCATDSTGVHNCRDFPSLLALDGKNMVQE